jgi:MYXO-CTERM domain-containing protein
MVQSTPPIGTEPRHVVGAALDLGAFELGNGPPDDGGGGVDAGATPPDASGPAGKHGGCGCASGNDEPGGWLLAGLVIASLCRRRRER